jgi:hypothetical protein
MEPPPVRRLYRLIKPAFFRPSRSCLAHIWKTLAIPEASICRAHELDPLHGATEANPHDFCLPESRSSTMVCA